MKYLSTSFNEICLSSHYKNRVIRREDTRNLISAVTACGNMSIGYVIVLIIVIMGKMICGLTVLPVNVNTVNNASIIDVGRKSINKPEMSTSLYCNRRL